MAYFLEETELMIGQEERYFQPPDEPARDVTLCIADDHDVRLLNSAKVLVLYFIYTSCPVVG